MDLRATRSLVATCIAVAVVGAGCLGDVDTNWLRRSVATATGPHRYAVFVPSGHAPERGWPVLLYLHGADGRGTDGITQTKGGLGAVIRQDTTQFPMVVVFPQGEPLLWSVDDEHIALAALDQTERELPVDPGRVYVAGYSRGGNAAWYLAYRQPARFAAIWAVAGWIEMEARAPTQVVPSSDEEPVGAVARRLSGTPVWLFHGEADPVVPVEHSRRLSAALRSRDAPIRYSELPGLGHDVWDSIDVPTFPKGIDPKSHPPRGGNSPRTPRAAPARSFHKD